MRKSDCLGLLAILSLLVACAPQPGLATAAVTPAETNAKQGYPPPLLPTSTRPAGYPAPTPAPTLDPTRATAIEQTSVAASTATTAALLQTLVAQGTRLPPTPGGPTLTPPAVPTRFRLNSKPECVAGPDFTRCYDALLGLTFEYPSAWGEIGAQYFSGATGYGYEYQFPRVGPYPMAGGRSRDFSEGRGRMLTDYAGFGAVASLQPENNVYFGALISDVVQANVVFMDLFPVANQVCDPGPGVIYSPIGIVAINLPPGGKINGFLFSADLLSDPLERELDGILGIGDQSQDAKCQDPQLQQQFDGKVKDIAAAIRSGTADSGTQANLNQLMHLAQSIRFN